MRNKEDIKNTQCSIKRFMERAKGVDENEYNYYLGVYTALNWIYDTPDKRSTMLHYKLVDKEA